MKKSLFTAFLVSSVLIAQSAFSSVITAINVQGNQRVEAETITTYINVSPGMSYAPALSSKVIKSLYKTGLFSDVNVAMKQGVLVIDVIENPLVNKVTFEGNKEVSDGKLQEITGLKSRAVYNAGKVQRDADAILAYYQQSGHFLTEISPQLIEREHNRVDVVFEIDEGGETEIERVQFVGNTQFTDAQLRTIVRTKETSWWRFLSGNDVYNEHQLEVDKELLRRHYIKNGYADFNVVSVAAELDPSGDRFFITFTLDEGKRYEFGAVDVILKTEEEGLEAESLEQVLYAKEGAIYNGEFVENDIDRLTQTLGERGFAFLNVRPRFTRDELAGIVGVSYHVQPGPRVYVNRINITGNERTRDYVLRREMRLSEGDAFSSTKLKRSKDRLTYLGFFEGVDLRQRETGMPDRVDVDINVTEQSTGEFSAGAGFSSYEGGLFTTEIRERNFLGKGQQVSLGATMSGRRQDIDFKFTEPFFMGRELSAGIDIFNEERDYQDESSYDINRAGMALRFGHRIGEFVRNNIRLGYRQSEITDVDAGTSQFIAQEVGTKDAITLTDTISYDNRDSYLLPTRGYKVGLTTEYSGFGSDIEHIKAIVNSSWHKELKPEWVLSIAGRAGAIWELNDTTPVFEMFRLGGNNGLRGFDYSGAGPRDATNNDALGGKLMIANTVEMRYPMGSSMKEMGVHGLMFLDGGMVTDFEDHPDVQDSGTYRMSVGTGVYWQSPMGPLRFELGFPIVKSSEDETRVFNFSFGTSF